MAAAAHCALTTDEAGELAQRLRGAGVSQPGESDSAAIQLERALEATDGEETSVTLSSSERAVLQNVIDAWLVQAGRSRIPQRVMALRYALDADARLEGGGG